MSFDELPPESAASRPKSEEEATTEQEASSQDAPPTSPSRRRTARSVGSDAASKSSATTAKKSSPVRAKRKATVVEENVKPVPIQPSDETALPVIQKPERPPASRRRASKTANEPNLSTAQPMQSEDVKLEQIPPASKRKETPTRRSQRTQESAEPPKPSGGRQVRSTGKTEDPVKPARHRATTKKEIQPSDKLAAEPPLNSDNKAPISDNKTPAERKPASNRRSKQKGLLPEKAEVPLLADDSKSSLISSELPERDWVLSQWSALVEATAVPVIDETPLTYWENTTLDSPDTISTLPADADLLIVEKASDEVLTSGTASLQTSALARNRRSRGNRNKKSPLKQELTSDITTEQIPAPLVTVPVILVKPVDLTVGAHLISRNGMPEIHINGVIYPPIFFFGNMEGVKNQVQVLSEVQRASSAGVHLHSTLIELPCPLSANSDALEGIDSTLKAILDADPVGFLMPRVVFVPARGWKRENPTEIAVYADGSTGDPSLMSERYWREAEISLQTLISHLSDFDWGKRIFGYHLERGEWFQPAEQGYDRSMANREAFRDWLKEKYKQNLVLLRAAWHDGDIQFHTVEIPAFPTKPNPIRSFYETRRERPIIDFHEFTSESTAHRLIKLGQTIKKASDNNALVSVCYGYTFEFGHSFSGHLALGTLEASTAIDLVCGPPSYKDRNPGGAASYPAPVDSLALHNKLWISEDDTKTHLSSVEQDPEDFNPRMTDRYQTEMAHSRAIGQTLCHATGINFMDLWGEGWLDDDATWEKLAGYVEKYALFSTLRRDSRTPDVVAIIDEKSLLHLQRGESVYRKLTAGFRDLLQRSSVSYGTYLQSDLLSDNFPTESKLYIFLTPYRLTIEQKTAIKEKLHGGDHTLVWLYAPGTCEERPAIGGVMEEAAIGPVGMTFRLQEWNSEVGSRFTDTRSPITERLNTKEIGVRERLNPSFYIDDPEASVLAEYQASGLPSIGVKNCGTWKSIFIGEPNLTMDLFRGICRYAGVHVWTNSQEDSVSIGNGWVTVHANKDGHRILRLPEPCPLYDVTDKRLIAQMPREHRFFMRNGMTRTFCMGSIERFKALNFSNIAYDDRPDNIQEIPKIDEPIQNIVAEEPIEKAVPLSYESDLATLRAVLDMDLSEVDTTSLPPENDYEIAHETPLIEPAKQPLLHQNPIDPQLAAILEPNDSRRRHRRRGGRGRGRAETNPETGADIAMETTSNSENNSPPAE